MRFKYTGVLSKHRVRVRELTPVATAKEHKARKKRQSDELKALFVELCRFHDVKPFDWMGLAMKLAQVHVPAFSYEETKRGPRLRWDNRTRAMLRFDVSIVRDERGLDVADACALLARREPYKSKLRLTVRNPSEALRRQYNLASPLWVKLVNAARILDQFEPQLGEETEKL
jgi:hypothetical protein